MTRWLIIWCVFVVGLLGGVGSSNAEVVNCAFVSTAKIKEYTDSEICAYATEERSNWGLVRKYYYLDWIVSPSYTHEPRKQLAVKEAKSRGLSCNVGETFYSQDLLPQFTSKRTACERLGIKQSAVDSLRSKKLTLLNLEFNSLSKDYRKKIQSKLAFLGYYKSTIDGLYGKGTAAALKAYNKEYLGNAGPTKSTNVKALLDDLLKEKPAVVASNKCQGSDTKSVKCRPITIIPRDEQLATTEQVEATEPAAPPPLEFAKVKASYDAGNFTQALKDAQTLSVEGNPDAQLYLGKMYANGRGTLQVTTSAHMWFNIASMNGSDEAFEERKAIQSQMTPELINEAQKMAVACIKSDYKDCGLLVQPSENKEQVAKKFQLTASELRIYFINQSTLQRKQIQYALKQLGYYRSSVDGLWGKGTRGALEVYLAADSSINGLDGIHNRLTSEVEVPSYFAAPVQKKKAPAKIVKTQPKYLPSQGYTSYGNPKMSVAQALDACKGTALNARDRASDAARFKSNSYSGNCYGNSYSTNCNARKNSPYGNDLGTAMAIGIMEGLTRGMAGKQAAERELKSCMAHYGWRKS